MSNLLNEEDYSYKHEHNTTIYWLRWILVIPVAFLLSVPTDSITISIAHALHYYSHNVIQVATDVLAAFVMLSSAKFIAPSHKKLVGLIIVLIFTLGLLVVLFVSVKTYYKTDILPKDDYLMILYSSSMIATMVLTHVLYKGKSLFGLSSDF